MESEYADVVPPRFFAALGFYNVRGHFPCGWEGEYPPGAIDRVLAGSHAAARSAEGWLPSSFKREMRPGPASMHLQA
jgi:hypothetical protein